MSDSSWISGTYVDGGGNIDEDPLFLEDIDPSTAPTTSGNLRLQSTSPAVDKGENDYVPEGVLTDLDGKARIQDGNADGDAVVDMGAYETGGYLPVDCHQVRDRGWAGNQFTNRNKLRSGL